jgi:hypothetical protein
MNFLYRKNPLCVRSTWVKKLSVFLFYLAFFLYVAASMLRDTTLLYDYTKVTDILSSFYWIAVILAAANILLLGDYTVGQMAGYLLFAVVYWISYKNYGNYRLFHSLLILLSARYVEWKPFVKRTFFFYGAMLLFVFFAYGFGLLTSVDIYYRGDVVRWTLGFVHPNLLGGYLMVLAMLWVAVRYETFNFFDVLVVLLLAAFTWVGPASRTSAMIMGLLLLIVLLSKLCGRWLLRSPILRFALMYVFPICFLFIFTCSYIYSDENPLLVKLDAALSGRVCYSHMFLDKYEHTWFGQKVKQVNNRTAMLTGKQAMYLDSSYMRLYIGVGIVGCLVTLWIFTRIMRYAVENARWDIIAGAAAMAVYGISELYITYIHWNFYLIVFAALPVLRPHDLRLGEKGWIKRLLLGTDSQNR